MHKPTLDDFIKDPNKAMRNGYYPDFMSCLALKASYLTFKEFKKIKDEFIWVVKQEAYLFPIYFLILLFYTIYLTTTPLLFAVWSTIYWVNIRCAYRKHHEKMKNRPKLIIDGVEQDD